MEIGNWEFIIKPMFLKPKTILVIFFALLASVASFNCVSAATINSSNSISYKQGIGINRGLVGWWTFDGADGATDKSGFGNNGTKVGGVTPVVGKIGQGLKFDGTGYIDLSTNPINLLQPYTFSAWIKYNTTTRMIVYSNGDHAVTPFYGIEVNVYEGGANTFGVRSHTGGQLESAYIPVTMNIWQYVVIVQNSSAANDFTFYLNGKKIAPTVSFSGVPPIITTYPRIGGRVVNAALSLPYSGTLDDVRIYNRALSPSEVRQLYVMGGDKVQSSTISKGGTLASSGLVSHWTFDAADVAGTQVYDKSGQNNVGIITGGVKKITGKLGQGMKFDGTSGYINAGTGLNMGNALTILTWVKTSNPGSGARILSKETSDYDSPYLIYYYLTDSSFYFFSSTSSPNQYVQVSFGPGLVNGVWHQLAVTYDGDTIITYADGIRKNSGSWTRGIKPSSEKFLIGSSNYGGSTGFYFKGALDDVRIYNRALSPLEIKQFYAMGGDKIQASTVSKGGSLTSGLVGHWTFDGADIAGTQVYDKSGGNNTGTMTGGVQKITGKLGQALKFNGTSGYISGTAPANMVVDNYTYSAWIKLNALPTNGTFYMVANVGGSTGGQYDQIFGIFNNYSGLTGFTLGSYNGSGGIDVTSSGSMPSANVWYHFVGVRNTASNNLKVYVNGTLVATSAALGNSAAKYDTAPYVFYIGERLSGLNKINGTIDDVRVYNRALSPAEIKQLYAMGK